MSNRQRFLTLMMFLVLFFTFLTIANAFPNEQLTINEPIKPVLEIDNKNIKIDLIKTYIIKQRDEEGREWTDRVARYKVTILQDDNSVQNKATTLPLDAYVESVIGTDAFYNYIRYYGTCYSNIPVTINMTEALLWWSGSGWLTEQQQPTYTGSGTAIATPIYLFRWPTLGIWRSRNVFYLMSPGYPLKVVRLILLIYLLHQRHK